MNLKGIGKKSRHKLGLILKKSNGVITPNDVATILNISLHEANILLLRWHSNGWLNRISNGYYTTVPLEASSSNVVTVDPWIVANKLFSPGYVGGISAIKHWDLSEQIFEITTFVTLKNIRTKHPNIKGFKFVLKHISPKKMFGTKTFWKDNTKILISDPHKTIVDLLDDPRMAGGMRFLSDVLIEYLNTEFSDIKVILDYSHKMANKTIFKRLGLLLEIIGHKDKALLDTLKTTISKGYSIFDPTMDNEHIVKKWGLKVPTSWKKEYDRKK